MLAKPVKSGIGLLGLVEDSTLAMGRKLMELKNGPGFYLQGFIAGERFEPTTLLSKSLYNTAFALGKRNCPSDNAQNL